MTAHTTTIRVIPRAVRVQKGRGMVEGLIYVEAYLPFDPVAFAEFAELVAKAGGVEVAAASNPVLASKALEPLDSQGEAMLAQDLIQLAHGFITDSGRVDVMHDQQARKSVNVVQSFVNTPEIASPNFYPGAWVVAIKLEPGSVEWAKVEAGELDAVSFQALVAKVPVLITMEGS